MISRFFEKISRTERETSKREPWAPNLVLDLTPPAWLKTSADHVAENWPFGPPRADVVPLAHHFCDLRGIQAEEDDEYGCYVGALAECGLEMSKHRGVRLILQKPDDGLRATALIIIAARVTALKHELSTGDTWAIAQFGKARMKISTVWGDWL